MKIIIFKPNRQASHGYVALMASIVISIVLLLLSTEAALLGWSTRFAILANESREEAVHLAHSCAAYSVGKILQNTAYRGGETVEFAEGVCDIFAFAISGGSEASIVIKIRANVDTLYATHEYTYRVTDINIEEPYPPDKVPLVNPRPSIGPVAWREVYEGP